MRDYANRVPRTPRLDGAGPPPHPTRSVRVAALLAWVIAALFAVTAALTLSQLDRVAALSDFGASPAQQDAARDSAMAMALFNLAVFGGAWALLGWLLRRGLPAAQVALTVLAVVGLGFGLVGLLREQPLPLLVTSVVQLVLQAGLLAFLWRRDANDYLRPRRP